MNRKIESYKQEMVGCRYRHFKGGIYLVTDIALDTETEEPVVIYRKLVDSGTAYTYARPLKVFLSEVDREKHPNAEQKMRFEKVDAETETAENDELRNSFMMLFVSSMVDLFAKAQTDAEHELAGIIASEVEEHVEFME